MCVDGHGNVGLSGAGMEVEDGMHAEHNRGRRMSGNAGVLPECEVTHW